MHWTEPRHSAIARARFWSPPAFVLRLSAILGLAVAVSVAFLFVAVFRSRSGVWAWSDAFAIGGIAGAISALATAVSRLRLVTAKRQKIELREREFWIRGDRDFTVRYQELRGYSIMTSSLDGTASRTLLLYPRADGHFSVGIPGQIVDQAIHQLLGPEVPFVTIIDEQALKRPN